MTYFTIAEKILDRITKVLDTTKNDYALLVGGGYAYESKKYLYTDDIGDIDCLLFFNTVEEILQLLSDNKFLERLGFDLGKSDKVYLEDILLYEKKYISLIRYSGYINGVKTGLKILTFSRLEDIYNKFQQKASYIVSHDSNNCIFVAKGTNAKEIILTSQSLDISDNYSDNLKHYIWPYYNWYINGNTAYIGAWTDFIAKGKILRDNKSKTVEKIQTQILSDIVAHTSKEIFRTKQWHKVFANNHYFSNNFKKFINQKISKIAIKVKINSLVNSEYKHANKSLVTTFPDRDLCMSFKGNDKKLVPKSSKEKTINMWELLFNKNINLEKFEDIIHILNAEAKRLNDLFTLAIYNKEFSFESESTLKYLEYDSTADFMINTNENITSKDFLNSLVLDTLKDLNSMKKVTKEKHTLLKYIIELRMGVIGYLNNLDKSSEDNLQVHNKLFINLYKKQKHINSIYNHDS